MDDAALETAMKQLRHLGMGCGDGSQLDDLEVDLEGFASTHPMFDRAIEIAAPKVIVEVGSWKGASVAYMASICDKLGLDTRFIVIDTWLGSNAPYWTRPQHHPSLQLANRYPTMFRQFCKNMHHLGLADRVIPMPMTAACGFDILQGLEGLTVDMVYIDAGHHLHEAWVDIGLYYQLVRDEGVLLGDDYIETFPGVVQAVNRFAAQKNVILTCDTGKWMFRKKPLSYPDIFASESQN